MTLAGHSLTHFPQPTHLLSSTWAATPLTTWMALRPGAGVRPAGRPVWAVTEKGHPQVDEKQGLPLWVPGLFLHHVFPDALEYIPGLCGSSGSPAGGLLFALQISWVMVPMGQYTHQLRGLNRTMVTSPSTVEVSIQPRRRYGSNPAAVRFAGPRLDFAGQAPFCHPADPGQGPPKSGGTGTIFLDTEVKMYYC